MNHSDFMREHHRIQSTHPELSMTPKDDKERMELQDVRMAYMRKLFKGGSFVKPLPYNKHERIPAGYSEAELLAKLPPAKQPAKFDHDFNDPLTF